MKLCTAKKTVLQDRWTATLTVSVLIGGLVLLTSCINSSDDGYSFDWYSSVIGGEPVPDTGAVPGEDDDYPVLGAIPEEPVNVSSPEEIDRATESLVADLANAQYSSGVIRSDDETTPSEIQMSAVEVIEEDEVTAITAGQEIEIAAATVEPMPEPAEIESETSVALVAPPMEAEIALAEVINETPRLAELSGETLVVVPAPAPEAAAITVSEVSASAADDRNTSLVALSERDDGDMVGSVTRLVETTMVVKSPEAEVVAVSDETIEVATIEPEPAAERVSVIDETFAGAAVGSESVAVVVPEPQPVAVTVPTVMTAPAEPVVTANQVPVISSQGVTFHELFSASSPNAVVGVKNIAAVGSPTAMINDATFTAAGMTNTAQALAAIIRFGNGSSSLGSDERAIVAQLAAIHAQTGGLIRLVGHASKSGGNLQSADSALVNFKISLDRATAVANELIRNGVPRGDISIEAAAATDSMAADAGIQNEAVDRRVEVFFGV